MHRGFFILLAAILPLATVGQAHAQVVRSQCFGTIDYAHELNVQNIALASSTPLGDGLVAVDLTAQLHNTGLAEFTLARIGPDLTATDLDIVPDHATAGPMSFGPIAPGATTNSGANLTVVLPDTQVADLLTDLTSGALPLVVHAEEMLHAAAGNKIGYLDGVGPLGDVLADTDGNVLAYTWPSENLPSVHVSAVRYESLTPAPATSAFAVFESLDPDRWFVMAHLFDEHAPGSGLPEALRSGLLDVLFIPDITGGEDFGWYRISLRDDLPPITDVADVFDSGSFCTGTDHHIDPTDGATRVHSIDGDLTLPLARNANAQGIRFNAMLLDGVEVSGQVQGHAIKPSLQLSVRPGAGKRVVARLETDLSFSASLTAEGAVQGANEEIELLDLCFPLPPLPLGPIEIPLSLHLAHNVNLTAELQGAATVGLQKRVASGYEMGWDEQRPAGTRFFSEASNTPSPMQFTPPRLLDDSQAEAQIGAAVQLTFNVGTGAGPDGNCVAGVGPYLRATAAGQMTVSPVEDEWWTLSHSAAVSAGLSLEVLGFSLIDNEAALVEYEGNETLGGTRGAARAGGVSEGLDQRWAVNVEDVFLDAPYEMNSSAVAALADGGAAIVSRAQPRLSRFDDHGRYLWDRRFALGYEPTDVFAGFDGTLYTAGFKTPKAWLAAHDDNGNLQWVRSYSVTEPGTGYNCLITSGAMNDDGSGSPVFVLAGSLMANKPKACALAIDANGAIVWSKIFEFGLTQQLAGVDTDGDGVDDDVDNCPWAANADQLDANGDGIGDFCRHEQHRVLGVSALSDGGFALVGNMRDTQTSSDALIVRLDAAGDVTWASGYYGRAREFNDVVEAYDGSVYLAGEADSTLLMTEAAFLVARIAADGSHGSGTLLFGDDTWEYLLANWDNDVPPSVVRSFNDGGLSLAPAPDGVVAVGHIGTPASNVVAGVAVKLNERLGTEWHATWDHPDHAEVLHSIAPTDGGYLLTGRTNSFNADNLGSLLLMKLPYEGRVEIDPAFGYVSRYMATGSTGESGQNQPGFAQLLFHSVDALAVDLGPVANFEVASSGLCATRLTETGADSPLTQCGDDDGDGIDNTLDNCTQVANADQRDTDADGYGNRCDADFNNDDIVNAADLGYLRSVFFGTDPHADLDGDGQVNVVDLGLLREGFFLPPGPSALAP